MFSEKPLPPDNSGIAQEPRPASDGEKAVPSIPMTVGIGASAGDHEPLEHIFLAIPPDCDLSFVVIMHLAAEEIADRLAAIAKEGCHLPQNACQPTTIDEELNALLAILRTRIGHDFSSYKKNTVLRRIERRMAVNEAGGLKKYLAILEESPHEAHILSQELLIGVTSFFRDPEAFEFLRNEAIPCLFANRNPEDPIRIWHPCCATGEEAYSVAILIKEYLEKENLQTKVQIFATDIDEAAVAQARAGFYSDSISSEVSEELLKKYFTRSENRWQVTKQLREMIVFAHHSLIKDPPFSRLDLLVCRNFLIYLNPDIQKRLIPLFHQVLRPGGFLFLGSAETVGLHSDLFVPIDNRWKIFSRQEGERRVDMLFPYSGLVRKAGAGACSVRPTEPLDPTPVALAEKLLAERYAPARVIINEKNEIIHYSNLAGTYLVLPGGELTRDLLKMAKEELRPALRAAIYKAIADQREVVFRGIKMVAGSGETGINVIVAPLIAPPPAGKLALVIFEPAPPPTDFPGANTEDVGSVEETSRDSLIRQLEEQLRVTDEQLQATSEQLETSNEGFMSANEELMTVNEELQSTNEELQSTNEELETSKEELQALNEELVTVNFELQGKVEELNLATSDLENLISSSEIATLFLDRDLNIKGFTPAAAAIFNLIQTDIGRPFRHFAGKIDWSTFADDTVNLLAGRFVAEQEITTLDEERCYLKRIFPYKTIEGKIDGIVVTFIDITDIIKAQEVLRRYDLLSEHSRDLILFVRREDGSILEANAAALKAYGYTHKELLGLTVHDLRAPESLALTAEQMVAADTKGILFESIHRCKDGGTFPVEVSSQGTTIGGTRTLISIIRDITERKQAEAVIQRHIKELRASNEDLESFNSAAVGRELRMIELKKEINEFCIQTGQPPRYPQDFDENHR